MASSSLKPLNKPSQSAIAFMERYRDSLSAIEPSEPCFLHFVNVCLSMIEDVKVPEKAAHLPLLNKIRDLSTHAERTCAVIWAQYVYAMIMLIPNKVIGSDKAVKYFSEGLSSIADHINYQCANAITSQEDMQLIEDATLRLVAVLIGSLIDDGKLVTCVKVIPDDGDLSALDEMALGEDVEEECLALARDNFGWHESFLSDPAQCIQLCARFNEIGKEIDKHITNRFLMPPRSQCDPEDWHVLDVLKFAMLLFFTNALARGYIKSPDDCLAWWRSCLVRLMNFQDAISEEGGAAVLQDGGVNMRHIADSMINTLDAKYTSHVMAFKTNLLLLLSQLGDDASSAAVSLANMLQGQEFDNMRQIAEEWYALFKPIANRCNLVASLHSHALHTMRLIEEGKYEDEIGVRQVTTLEQIKANDPERMTVLIKMISNNFPSILSPIKLPSVIAQRESLAVQDVRSVWRFSYSSDDTRDEVADKADAMLSSSSGDYEAYVSALRVLQTCIKEATRAHICAVDVIAKRLIDRIGATGSDKVNINNIGAILPNLLRQMATGLPEMQQNDPVLSARTAYLLSFVLSSETFSTNVVRLLCSKNLHPAQAARMAKYAMRSAESAEQESNATSGIPSISQLVYARDDNPLLISDDEEEEGDDDIF